MINVKSGVDIRGICPELLFGIMVCDGVFSDLNQRFTITSVKDGQHMNKSLHCVGLAFDIRIFDLRKCHPSVVVLRLSEALGSQFQVVAEPDHIHVEFQP